MTDPRQLDVRTVHRYIAKGLLAREEYDRSLAALPDLEGEAEFLNYETQFASEEPKPVPVPSPTPVFVSEPEPQGPPNYGFGPPPGMVPPGTDGQGGSTI
ncbi:MAG: hypothetical protein ACFB9M_10895 [Myxococcota bacterium]